LNVCEGSRSSKSKPVGARYVSGAATEPPCSTIAMPPTRPRSTLMVSGLAPAAMPASKSSRLVAAYVHFVVESWVCHVVTRDASGACTNVCISQCGSTLYWYAYQLDSFCLLDRAHVRRPLLSYVYVPPKAWRDRSSSRRTAPTSTGKKRPAR